MKKLYKYIVLVIGILAFSACADEELVGSFGETGSDVTLSLSLKPEINKEIVNSRATAEENKLYDLHIYVFNASGDLTGYEKLEDVNGGITSPGPVQVNIRTKTGPSYIYAVANININESGSTYSLIPQNNALLNVTTGATSSMSDEAVRTAVTASNLDLTTFLGINFNRRFGSENELFSPDPDGKFMMSGYLNDGNQVTIKKGQTVSIADENEVTITQPIIKLYRILAKNTFTITSFNGTGKKGTFTPKYYRLCNVPKTGVLIPKSGISNPAAYVSNNFTTAQVESSYRWNFEGNTTITF